jgi:uncharacterized membrane protein
MLIAHIRYTLICYHNHLSVFSAYLSCFTNLYNLPCIIFLLHHNKYKTSQTMQIFLIYISKSNFLYNNEVRIISLQI